MRKIVLLDDHFPTGEQTVQPVLLWGPGRQDLSRITKTASEALDYIKSVSPEPGKTNLLVLALGSEEAYGPNRNGDGFPESPVPSKAKGAGTGSRWWVSPGEELTKHYQSFETNPAHAFKHHQNRDPSKASGYVKKAFWNPRMHRVELLIVVDNNKDPEWVQRVNDGEFPPVSMGCRIKYDVCSICGNQAPTRAHYCDHAKFQMNQILPDGRRAYVHNPSPNFFDISRVFRPADKTGYTLKKVAYAYEIHSSAELGETADALDNKRAAIRKLSDIDKIVRGQPVAASSALSAKDQKLLQGFVEHARPRVSLSPDIPSDLLRKHAMGAVLSTATAMGILLKDAEFIDYVASASGVRLSPELRDKVSSVMPLVYDVFEASPALFDEVISIGALDESREKVSAALAKDLAPYAEKRAYVGEMLYRRLVPEGVGLRPDEAPRTDLLHYTDPNSGQTLTTTRGAAIDAQDSVTRAHMRKVLGGSALLLGGYKMLSMAPYLRAMKLPLAAGAGALGYAALHKRPHEEVATQEGVNIPSMTEFAPKTAHDANETAVLVHLVESCAPAKHATASSTSIERMKAAGYIDSVRGLLLDFEATAEEIGRVICS